MIIALQYYQGDLEATMRLARLLADLEEEPRYDVLLALVRQPDTEITPLVERTIAHCQRKFDVESVASKYWGKGHPEGCTALWKGTIEHYYERFKKKQLEHHSSIFTLDGGDGIPLFQSWLSLAGIIHNVTLERGKLISGSPYFLGTCPLHINPNAIFEFEVFEKTKLLTDFPVYDRTLNTHFDIYHREEMLEHTNMTSIVRTDWRGGGNVACVDLLNQRSRQHLWLHGYKDPNLTWLARENILSNNALSRIPSIEDYSIDQMKLKEKVQRSFEESCQ